MTQIELIDGGAYLTKESGPIFLSGACGSEIDRIIAEQDGTVNSIKKGSDFRAPLHAPPVVKEVHRLYTEAGADILTAESFCASVGRTKGNVSLAQEHAAAAAAIAQKVSRESLTHHPLIALSLTSSGDCYTPDDTPNNHTLLAEHGDNIGFLKGLGDFILAETIPTLREAQIIAEIANEHEKPFLVAFVVGDDGNVLDGSPIDKVVETVLKPHPYCLGVGVNCCDIEGANEAVFRLSELFNADLSLAGKHIVAYPNAFKLTREQNAELDAVAANGSCTHEDHNQPLTVYEGLEVTKELIRRGASAVGLCCGSTPKHTEHYVTELQHLDLGTDQTAYKERASDEPFVDAAVR